MLLKKIMELIKPYRVNKEKYDAEFTWWEKYNSEVGLTNDHYELFFTEYFDLDKSYYDNKIILDIGCGPQGSLEWANTSKKRVGLDPLVNKYKKLGILNHSTEYISAYSENIPFEDNYFDVVSSFNSLDHVDDLDKTISEIKRVIKPEGLFLLITDVNHDPTPCEPLFFSFDIVNKFKPLKLITEKHFEKNKNGVYESLLTNTIYNHENNEKRYGILLAKFKK